MRDDAFQQAAEQLLQDAVDAGATPSEKRRLQAGPGAIVVRLSYAPIEGSDATDLVVLPAGAEPIAAEDRAETPELATIYRRIQLRSTLGLPKRECYALRQQPACRCLSDALDQALEADSAPDKRLVFEAAKETHKRFAAARKQAAKEERARAARVERDKQQREVEERHRHFSQPSQASTTREKGDEEPKPLWRQKGGLGQKPHPDSWRAFKDAQEGRIDWSDAEF